MTPTTGSPAAENQTLRKGFNLRSATALAFADVSPIVALYAIFTLGLLTAGPGFWWAFPIVLAGQLLVACVFGELASRWPYEGSVYQWARHVHGPGAGWFSAWAYMWGLTIALSALSYGAAGFLLQAFDVEEPSKTATVLTTLGILAFGSFANIIGRGTLKVLVIASLICEALASVVLGTVLLIFYRENPVSVLFEGIGGAPLLGAPLLAATAYVGWSFVGFEAAGSIAEEVEKPERDVPKALIVALASVGAIVMYSAAGLILAIPDLDAAGDGDPVTGTLVHHFGSGIGRPLLILFVIGFVASFLAVQAAVSRVIWASARDKALPGSTVLGRLALAERMPVNAILLTAVGAAVFVLLSGSTLYAVLVNFTTIGFYVAFGLPVWGSALQHLRGTWRPGVFNLGRWSAPVTYVAAVWLAVQTVNIVWPRDTAEPWYIDWSMVMTFSVVAVAGAILYLTYARRRIMPRYGDRLGPPSSGT